MGDESSPMHPQKMTVPALPVELLALVACHLEDVTDLNAFLRCSHTTHSLKDNDILQASWLMGWHRTTALHIACQSGKLPVVQLLLDNQAVKSLVLDIPDDWYLAAINSVTPTLLDVPLSLAAKGGHATVVQLLLATPGIDVNGTSSSKPLRAAWRSRSLAVVQLLLQVPQTKVTFDDLSQACEEAPADIVRALLHHVPVDVNSRDPAGRTLLYAAVRGTNVEALQLLLGMPGVDVNAETEEGWTALHRAVAVWDEDDRAAECGELLLSTPGIDVNAVDPAGVTPLHCAVGESQSGAVQKLLTMPGIMVNARDVAGSTPFNLACRAASPEIGQKMLSLAQHLVDVNTHDNDGHTPLHNLCWNRSKGVADLLQRLLAVPHLDVNRRTPECLLSPMELMHNWGRVDLVRVLFKDCRLDRSMSEEVEALLEISNRLGTL